MSRPVVTVLAVLLALVPFSGADTVHVILIGEGSLYGQQEPPPRYNFTFFTADSPSPFTVATLNDFTENSGFGQCNPCDPKFLVGDLLLDEGIGHNAFGYYSGNILFTSVSFKSSLLPSAMPLSVASDGHPPVPRSRAWAILSCKFPPELKQRCEGIAGFLGKDDYPVRG